MRHKSLRLLSLALLLSALSALSACSSETDFVIVNDSGWPVEVRYTFKSGYRYEKCCSEPPAKKALDKLDDDHTLWRDLSPGELSYDPAAGAVTLTLSPGEALRVFRGSGWQGHGGRSEDESFIIGSVRIAGANGIVEYEGRQAQYQFQRRDDNLYKLTYYGWGDKRDDGGR